MTSNIQKGILRTEQTLKVNFGRIESLCGYIIIKNAFKDAPARKHQ